MPPAALVKAVLLNSANDTGRPAVDFVSGFGQTDALGAVQTVREQRSFTNSTTETTEQVFTITIPAGSPELKVTLARHDPAAQALVNDLRFTTDPAFYRAALTAVGLSTHSSSLARPARRRADHLNICGANHGGGAHGGRV